MLRRTNSKILASMVRHNDPATMPKTGETPQQRIDKAIPLMGTAGQAYVEKRGISVEIADKAGLRFDPNFDGRPAVLMAMRDQQDQLVGVHGRYLHFERRQNKMLTIGRVGVINVLGGWHVDPIILVEGVFDALSVAMCGYPAVATIGRWSEWLPEAVADRMVLLASDTGRPGEDEAAQIAQRLHRSDVLRMPPPPNCKDWNTALVKLGRSTLTSWLRECIASIHAS